jgi:putative aldouronate transport system permease protein
VSEKFSARCRRLPILPHFISIIVICGLIRDFTALGGVFNQVRLFFGLEEMMFLTEPSQYRTLLWLRISGRAWAGAHHLPAALTGVDTELYEAAKIDGGGRFKEHDSRHASRIAPHHHDHAYSEDGRHHEHRRAEDAAALQFDHL